MPELPEVESVRRSLERAGIDAPVTRVWRSRKALRTGAAWRQENLRALRGAQPGAVERRGKFLIWRLRGERSDLGWLVHLGMSGRFQLASADAPKEPHTHVVVTFADGHQVRFVDPRRFGGMRVAAMRTLLAEPPLSELGPEPLEAGFDGAVLSQRAGASKRALRDVLLDQRVVAGIGNIYVSEILFRARVHPLCKAHRIRPAAWDRLAEQSRRVLESAVANGGTSLRDYRNADGDPGRNQNALAVYGRAALPCPDCGTTLLGYVHAGRSGVYCPKHQRRPVGGWVK